MSEEKPEFDRQTMEDGVHLEPTFTRDEDKQLLAQIGHVQELQRSFSIRSLGGLCLCLMATWEALSTVVASALVSGGAPCLLYNYILSAICSIAIAASMGEIASIWPTAGGQYHWVAVLSPERTRRSAAWFAGWISVGGQIVLTASAAFAAGLQTQSLIILNDNSYIPQRYEGMLLYCIILLYGAAINVWGSKMLPRTNYWADVLHICGLVSILAVLGALAPKNNAKFVFADVQNSSGWRSDGVAWLVGLLSTVYPMLGYDAAAHVSEEIPHADRNVPLVMVGTVVVNSILGFGYCIMLLYSTGPLEALLETPTGFAFMQIYLTATKSPAGATVMSLILIVIAIAATSAGMTSTSRTLWAFARDGATPFPTYLSKVSKEKQIPERAIAIVLTLQLLLGFIYLGNTTAFNAVLSMAIIGMYLSYLMPIIAWLVYGRPSMQRPEFGSFYMGNAFGILVNIISIIWLVVVIIFSTFPGALPVSAKTMNYSSVVMGGWILFGAVYYFAGGSKRFNVPVVRKSDGTVRF